MMQRLLQFTLDLFESVPAPLSKKSKKRAEKLDFQGSSSPLAQVSIAQAATENVADALPTQTLQQALAPVTFSHPRASRQTLLDGIAVAYEFKRGKRRTIGFSVGAPNVANQLLLSP